ncbi:MAG: sporulation protein YunB [Bacilli bacterium]
MKRKWLKLLITFILLIIFTFIILVFLSNKVMPFYMNYSEAEMKRVVTTVINKSVTEEVTNQLEVDSLFVLKKENDNTIIVDFDPVIVNRVMSKISDVVYNNLKLISKKDKLTLEKYNLDESYFYIPSGIIFNTTMLNNIGPRIPINLEIISSVNPNLKTEVTEYGINNSLIEVYINVIVDVKMILPMYSNTMQIVVVVPLAVKLIQGEVPKYYQRGYTSSTLFFDEKSI